VASPSPTHAQAPALFINGILDAIVVAGTSGKYNITITNASPSPLAIQSSVSGDISAWASVSPTSLRLAAGKMGVFVVAISVPVDTRPDNYYGYLLLRAGDSEGSALIKVKVPAPTIASAPASLELAMPPSATATASVVLTSIASDAHGITTSLVGEVAKFGRIISAPTELRLGSWGEVLLEFATAAVSPGMYLGALVVSVRGTETRTNLGIRVLPSGALVQVQLEDRHYLVQAVDAGATSRAQLTLSERSGRSELGGILVRASSGLTFASAQPNAYSLTAGGSAKGTLTIAAPTNIRCGYHFGKVSVKAGGITYAEAPVVVKAYCPAGPHILIDGILNDWTELKVATLAFGKEDPSLDPSTNIIVTRATEASGYFLIALNVRGDVNPAHGYGLNFDTNGDGRPDYSLVFAENGTVILAGGKLAYVPQNSTWAYSSGVLEAAVDARELRNVIGASFSLQAFASSATSRFETEWFPYRAP